MTASVPAIPAGDDLGDRIRRNLEEGSEARRTGSEARTRADAFVTNSALLVYEVLQASLEGEALSPTRAASILADNGLELPSGRTLHTNIARAVMGRSMDGDRLRRVAYAALELLEGRVADPEGYIRNHGGVKGLAVRRERRLNPGNSRGGVARNTTTMSCYVLVCATKGANADQREMAEQHAVEIVSGPTGTMWILPAASALVELLIARAIVPLRQASDPAELAVSDEPKPEARMKGRRMPSTLVDEASQPGLPF